MQPPRRLTPDARDLAAHRAFADGARATAARLVFDGGARSAADPSKKPA